MTRASSSAPRTVARDIDLTLLEEIAETARRIQPLLERYPEYRDLYGRAVHLHKEITELALQNERGA